jgi:hypothetical protein
MLLLMCADRRRPRPDDEGPHPNPLENFASVSEFCRAPADPKSREPRVGPIPAPPDDAVPRDEFFVPVSEPFQNHAQREIDRYAPIALPERVIDRFSS